MVMVSPRLMSPSFVRQRSLPVVGVDGDRVAVERVEDRRGRRQYAAPRLTTSQQATPCAAGSGLGSNFQFSGRARLGEVQRVEDVRERRDDVHRVAHDQRRRFLAALDAQRERERDLQATDVAGVDLGRGR